MTTVVIREATEADVPAMNAIYNEYIVDSHVSFDTEAWPDAKRLAWFRDRAEAGYPVFVADDGGEVIGTSWSGPYRDKAAYATSAETTVVLAPGASGAGVGSALLAALLAELAARGFGLAVAIVALPNDASVAVHEKLGYSIVGTLHGVGHKNGAFHDTMLLERPLTEASR